MTLPQNQKTAQTDWRGEITRLRAVDGWKLTCETDTPRLVPVKGKNPGISGARWQDKTFTVEQVTGQPGATGCGLVTGPQPTGDSVICLDFDGYKGVEFAKEHGVDPGACSTWQIVRTGADGQTTKGRAKFLFRTTPEQRRQLGEHFTLKHTIAIDDDGKQEGIEVFHHGGRQVVVLGAHPEGGHYFWPEGRGPEALKVLPDDMLRLIKAVAEASESGISALTDEELKQRTARLNRESKEWRRMKHGETCPICGRDGRKGESHICAVRKDDAGVVRCFDGNNFSYKQHGTLAPGSTIQGRDGQLWAFTSEAVADGIGMRGNFRVHRDRSETVVVPATPEPWTVSSEAGTTTWDAAIGLPEEQPASEQTVDVTTAAEAPYNKADLLERAQALKASASNVEINTDDDTLKHQIADLARKAGVLDAYAGGAAAESASEAVRIALGTAQVGLASEGGLVKTNEWRAWVKKARDATYLQLTATRKAEAAAKQSQLVQAVASSMVLSDEGERWKLLLSLLPGVVSDPDKAMNLQQVAKAFQPLEGNVRFNTLRNSVEVHGADGVFHALPPDQISDLYVHLNRHGWHIAQKPAGDAVLAYARANRVNPARDYLETLRNDDSIPLIDLRTVCSQVFRHGDQFVVDDQLSSELVRTWLLGAVHRLLEPGCEMQGMLVLKGLQGTGKSRFFQALMPDRSWCVTAQAEATGKDQRELMQRGWVIVLEELDGLTGKKAVAEMKALVTAAWDVMRLSYERFAWQYPRPSVMGATVNDDSFLPDVTGNRRYWVIDTCPLWIPEEARKGYADHVAETTARLRDSIWRTALLEAEGGATQFLAADIGALLAEANVAYEPESPMFGPIKEWQQGMPQGTYATIDQVLKFSGAFGGDAARINKADQMAAGRVLTGLGWHSCRARKDGKGRQTYWVKTSNPNPGISDMLYLVKKPDSPWGY